MGAMPCAAWPDKRKTAAGRSVTRSIAVPAADTANAIFMSCILLPTIDCPCARGLYAAVRKIRSVLFAGWPVYAVVLRISNHFMGRTASGQVLKSQAVFQLFWPRSSDQARLRWKTENWLAICGCLC